MDLDFAALCDAHYQEIARYVGGHRVSPSTVDDLVQRVFLEARDKRATYDPSRGSPKVWLFGIAANVVKGHFRESRTMRRAYQRAAGRERVDHDDELEQLISRLDARAMRKVLDEGLRSLRFEHREVLLLEAWTNLTQPEIASALGKPPGTIKTHLYEARAHMVDVIKRSVEHSNG